MADVICFQEKDPLLWERLVHLPEDVVFVSRTDTIYGLGCRHDSIRARERILTLKKREESKFITLIRELTDAKNLCEISDPQMSLLEKYWPGPITFILNAKHKGETLALRLPKSPFLEKLMLCFKHPLLSTSCNISGSPPVKDIQSAQALFQSEVDFYIDGGTVPDSEPSTLVDLTQEPPQVLRKGALAFTS